MKKYIIILAISFFFVLPAFAEENFVTSRIETTSTIGLFNTTSTLENRTSTDVVSFEVKTDRELLEQSSIRVDLMSTKDMIKFKSGVDYTIYSGSEVVGLIAAGEECRISYKKGKYYLTSKNIDLVSDNFWRLEPVEAGGVFEIVGCKRTVTGRKAVFCTYRGIFEYRYGIKSKIPFLINELPLEDYMKGIAETDNNSAEGYMKAVLVAARSYAYKNISFLPPTEKRLFDVYASTQDQLYLGYNSEIIMPRVAQFAQETAGEMVTYDGSVVTTPYFTHTNGSTKTWKNYNGKNDRPWLVSVKCIYDKYKKMYGHGVGMSTHDALMRATKDDWVYVQLLKYYYSGTEVEKIY